MVQRSSVLTEQILEHAAAAPTDQARWGLLVRDLNDAAAHEIEATLNAHSTAIWVVRHDLHIEFSNFAAQALARSKDWVRESSGTLQGVGHLGRDALRGCLQQGKAIGAASRVVSTDIRGRLIRGELRIIPVSQTALYSRQWPRGSALLMLQTPVSSASDDQWHAHLSDRFHLTKAQSGISEDLARGLSVERIAATRGIKEGTVRSHLHELLDKTGRTKQGDLVRLALGV